MADIEQYLQSIGGEKTRDYKYSYKNLEITITICPAFEPERLCVPRHEISVSGDKETAGEFLTNFRKRFLSAGG